MDSARFYGKNLLTNTIRGDGILSDDDDLDYESDDSRSLSQSEDQL